MSEARPVSPFSRASKTKADSCSPDLIVRLGPGFSSSGSIVPSNYRRPYLEDSRAATGAVLQHQTYVRTVLLLLFVVFTSCASREARGIADSRTDFRQFAPMKADPARDGLKPVKPYFRRSDRSGVLRAIERACDGRRRGSSVYDERTGAGYYVNCNPRNRQLLNGYVSVSRAVQPHSR